VKKVKNRLIPFDFRWYRPYYPAEWWYSLLTRAGVVISTLQVGAGSMPQFGSNAEGGFWGDNKNAED
jgi:hypothetical protein